MGLQRDDEALQPYLADARTCNTWFRRALWAISLAIAAAMLAMGTLMHVGHLPSLAVRAAMAMDASPAPLIAMIIGAGAAMVIVVLIARPRHALAAWAGLVFVLWSVWGLAAYPLLNGYSSGRDVMVRTAKLVPPKDQIALVAWKEHNLLMLDALDRTSINYGFLLPWHEQLARALAWQKQDPAHRWIFALGSVLAPCVHADHATHVGRANHREWYLFKSDAVVPGCVPPVSDDAGQVGAIDPDADE